MLNISLSLANMPDIKYEHIFAKTDNTQMEASQTKQKVFKRSRIERSIASEVNQTESKTEILGYFFILALPLLVGAWFMRKKGLAK